MILSRQSPIILSRAHHFLRTITLLVVRAPLAYQNFCARKLSTIKPLLCWDRIHGLERICACISLDPVRWGKLKCYGVAVPTTSLPLFVGPISVFSTLQAPRRSRWWKTIWTFCARLALEMQGWGLKVNLNHFRSPELLSSNWGLRKWNES